MIKKVEKEKKKRQMIKNKLELMKEEVTREKKNMIEKKIKGLVIEMMKNIKNLRLNLKRMLIVIQKNQVLKMTNIVMSVLSELVKEDQRNKVRKDKEMTKKEEIQISKHLKIYN